MSAVQLRSKDALKLLQALLNQTNSPQEFSRLCCRAGLCPLLLKDKLKKQD
ncbi:hypothetical protein EZJ49_14120 [Bdellovibrio bacteriovorus]|uniref:hypothetical protein n=1 Tax=Bdellovibrio bacteriovorus TaxID=959 RepID=UPI0021CDF654|nr:hypothetical protein [Bdellovibrio bacteriovorus]UXR64199.1 hypothetical protein EZJ49_14120 [Bdellovibrio bacteriovorus]